VAKALGPATNGPRAIVVNPASGAPALELYTPLRAVLPGQTIATLEIDVVDLRHNPPHLTTTIAIQGFTTCALRQTPEFIVVRYCAPGPVAVVRGRLIGLRLVAASPQPLVGP
jgi:hypothetical protein